MLYVIVITIAVIWLAISGYKKSNTIELLHDLHETIDVEICMLDVVDCPGEAKIQSTIASWYDYTLDNIEWSKKNRTAASREFVPPGRSWPQRRSSTARRVHAPPG